MFAIVPTRIFTGDGFLTQHSVLIAHGKISQIVPVEKLPNNIEKHEYPGCTLTSGFIDLQVNGGGGVMFNRDTSVEGIEAITTAHRRFGTTYILPTLITDTKERMKKALKAADNAIQRGIDGVLGVHLEGPWLNPEKKGAHNDRCFHIPTSDELDAYPWLKSGKVLCTLAPEKVPLEIIQQLKNSGVIVFAGHSNANYGQIHQATLESLDGYTHLFNAMSPITNREPGLVGIALNHDQGACSIITDGIHVHPQNVLMAKKLKPNNKLFIVTDAMATVGSSTDQFILNDEVITVQGNKLVNKNGSLAGAHVTFEDCVKNIIDWGINEDEALRMASTYPAQVLGVDDRLGHIRKGYEATFTLLNQHIQTVCCYVRGKLYLA